MRPLTLLTNLDGISVSRCFCVVAFLAYHRQIIATGLVGCKDILRDLLATIAYSEGDGGMLVIFITLMTITFYRKRLSVNNEYMEEGSHDLDEDLSDLSRKAAAAASDSALKAAAAASDSARRAAMDARRAASDAQAAASAAVGKMYASASTVIGAVGTGTSEAGVGTPGAAMPETPTERRRRGSSSTHCLALEALPRDAFGHCFAHLDLASVLGCAPVSRSFARSLDRPLGHPVGCVWRDRWVSRFGALWRSPVLRCAAARHGVAWDPLASGVGAAADLGGGTESAAVSASETAVRATASIWPAGRSQPRAGATAAAAAALPPNVTWRAFYFDFDASWLDWCLVGHNRCASAAASLAAGGFGATWPGGPQRCLVGLHGAVLDVGSFLPAHPGSPETLLDNCGGDATDLFEDIGHSRSARQAALPLLCLAAPPLLTRASSGLEAAPNAPPPHRSSASSSRPQFFLSRAERRLVPILRLASAEGRSVGKAAAARALAAAEACPSATPAAGVAAAHDAGSAAWARGGRQRPCAGCSAAGRGRCPLRFAAAAAPAGPASSSSSAAAAEAEAAEQAAAEALCAEAGEHVGRCRVFFDPFARAWGCWWTCCHAHNAALLPGQ